MEDDLTRAQHYRDLAKAMRNVAEGEADIARKHELLELAQQYDRLVEAIVGKAWGIDY